MSVITLTDTTSYEGRGYASFGSSRPLLSISRVCCRYANCRIRVRPGTSGTHYVGCQRDGDLATQRERDGTQRRRWDRAEDRLGGANGESGAAGERELD